MDKAELVQLIISRSPKLRSLRDQTANANKYISFYQVKKKVYMSQLCYICFKIDEPNNLLTKK